MIKRHNVLSLKLTIYSLVASLILQSCSNSTRLSNPTLEEQTDKLELINNQASLKKRTKVTPLRRKKSQTLGKENLPKNGQLLHSYDVGERSLKKTEGEEERVEKKTRKRKEVTEKIQAISFKYEREEEKNGNQEQVIKKQEKSETLRKSNQGIKRKAKRRNKPGIKLQRVETTSMLNNMETSNKEVEDEKERESVSETTITELGLLDLPAELIEVIVSHLRFQEAMIVRQLNHYFYEFVTGYHKVGVIGLENKPDRTINKATWSIRYHIHFDKLKDRLTTMPSFVFYQLIKEVKNLPQECWLHLEKTQVRTIYLGWNKLGPKELEMLGKCLQTSKISKVYLWRSQIDHIGAETFGKTLVDNNNIRELNLERNKLCAIGVKRFTEYLPRTLRVIILSDNCIGDIGAIDVAKNVQNKEIEEIDLGTNKIGDKGAIGAVENLQGTLVKSLCLASNKITDKGAIGIANNIPGTNLEELYLGYNQITNKGVVEIIKYCRSTRMKKLNLSFNEGITDEGVIEIAENVEGTKLEEIDLRQYTRNSIGKETQELVKKKCPYIKWIFV